MAQLHINATVTDGSANVTLPGDVVAQIKVGDYFKLVGIIGVYEIASRSLVSGNTRITLTAPYVGDSGTYPALVHRDFTARGYPLFYEGDLDIPDILRRWALQMDGEVTHAEDVAGEAVAAHVAQPDPHPQYTLQSLLNLGKSTTTPATPITGSLLSGAMLAAGAIVEMGQNANGSYWRWEGGLQVCIGRVHFLGSGTGNRTATWTLPAAFASETRYIPLLLSSYYTTFSSIGLSSGADSLSMTAISASFGIVVTSAGAGSITALTAAIGWWK